jgi:hypothetical protein
MKRTSTKDKKELKLARRLELVRTTIRQFKPKELTQINGGSESPEPGCPPRYTEFEPIA